MGVEKKVMMASSTATPALIAEISVYLVILGEAQPWTAYCYSVIIVLYSILVLLAVQDSSIGDIVTH